jgi:hypothetical protein
MPAETILGIETFWLICLVAAAYFFVGAGLFWHFVAHDEPPIRAWRFGDPPRRPEKSFEARVLEHIGGVAVFLSICVFGLRGLGFG